MSTNINESIEKILLHKGALIKKNDDYRKYVRKILKKHGIKPSKATVEAFVMGAVDAMIYDISCSLGRKAPWLMRENIISKLWGKKE